MICCLHPAQVQDVGAEKDAITSLRAPTHFGRPNWDRVFGSISEKHPETDVGVVSVTNFTYS
jgi:NADPH oxidase 2